MRSRIGRLAVAAAASLLAGAFACAAASAPAGGAPVIATADAAFATDAELASLPHAEGTPLQRIVATGVLRVGTTGDYAPFTVEREGRLQGADVALARRLASHLGVRPVFVRTQWGSLAADLGAGRFDVAIGGVSVTAERAAVGTFSAPYAHGGKTIVARCRDARRFGSLAAADRPGVRVVVNPGGTNEAFVRGHVRRAIVRVHPDNRTIFEEIRAGRADLMITDDVEVELQSRLHPELCRAMRGTLTRSSKAILMARDDALVARVDEWLAGEVAAGVPAALREAFVAEMVRRGAATQGR